MTQEQKILDYLEKHPYITSRSAVIDLGIIDLRKRVSVLRKSGFPILDSWQTSENRYGEKVRYKLYYLADKDN